MRKIQDRARSARFKQNAAQSATIESHALGALKLTSEVRDENVPSIHADIFIHIPIFILRNKFWCI